jgi:hypothetical protein
MILTSLLFLTPPALAFDHGHGAFNTLLQAHVAHGRVDYKGLATDGPALDAYIAALGSADLGSSSRDQKMAFWINAYNALTLDLIVDSLPLSSIMDLEGGKVWDKRSWTIAGRAVTLNQIEHQILRPMGDPRIHAAVNCASMGCPPLQSAAFIASGLDAQLDRAIRAWALGNGITVQGERVGLNSIFDWFGDDFIANYGTTHFDIPGVQGKPEAAINLLAPHLDTATQQRLRAGGYATYWTPYDWKLNQP